ncbi:hypothetical protein M0811_14460 [Anaeramoeba ignava]|uniref:t-SNARE coiled-coil homology domain-containing protein n=1 Tax=Anaeramoeba ignava TaxID=1746090 RepID=A0A9Q0RI90_ANAIG|nr:hypothetical protein M0811_14460 [Anaeramoeba ignava]
MELNDLTAESWLDNFDELERFASENHASIREYNRLKMKGSSNAAQSSKIRKNIKIIKEKYESLKTSLEKMAQSRTTYGIIEDEIRRRKNNLNKMKITIEKMDQEFSKGVQEKHTQIAFGEETEQTKNLTNDELLQMQKDTMNTQDQHLDLLSNTIRKQKEIGLEINDELDIQSKLLDDMTTDVDRVDHKLEHQTGRIGKLMKSTRNRWIMICVCILIALVIFLGVTKGGTKF